MRVFVSLMLILQLLLFVPLSPIIFLMGPPGWLFWWGTLALWVIMIAAGGKRTTTIIVQDQRQCDASEAAWREHRFDR